MGGGREKNGRIWMQERGKVEDEEEEAERRMIGKDRGGGEGDKNVVWEQIKVL